MTTKPRESIEAQGNQVSREALQQAVQAVVDTCRIQMGLHLEVDPSPADPREATIEFGSSIPLTFENGGWNLAVMGDRNSCEALTRNLFAMADDERPEREDMADGLGEIANVAAGVMKSNRVAAGQNIQFGLPSFMEGRGCLEFFADDIRGMAQTVRGENDLQMHIILSWREG